MDRWFCLVSRMRRILLQWLSYALKNASSTRTDNRFPGRTRAFLDTVLQLFTVPYKPSVWGMTSDLLNIGGFYPFEMKSFASCLNFRTESNCNLYICLNNRASKNVNWQLVSWYELTRNVKKTVRQFHWGILYMKCFIASAITTSLSLSSK